MDARRGSFADQTGRRTVTVNGSPEIKRGDKGTYFESSLVKYLTYSSQILPNGAFTIVAWIKITKKGEQKFGIVKVPGGALGFHFNYNTTGSLLLFSGANYRYFVDYSLFNYNWNCIILTLPGSAQTDINNACLYINGDYVLPSTTGATEPQVSRSTITTIGGQHGGSSGLSNISYVATYDHVFTEAERAKAYSDFLNSYLMLPEKYPQQSILNKPMDLSRLKDTGLVAAYNMIPNGNTLVDISGNGWNLTKISRGSSTTIKDGIRFYGKYYSQNTGNCYSRLVPFPFNTIGSFTVSGRIKVSRADYSLVLGNAGGWMGFNILTNNTGSLRVRHGSATERGTLTTPVYTPFTFSIILDKLRSKLLFYIDGVFIQEVDSGADGVGADWSIGGFADGLWGFNGDIYDIRVHNKILSVQEVKAYHNSFVKPSLIEDFSSEGADGIAKVPSGWIKQSGSFKIGEITTPDSVLKTIKKGTKYLECVTAGILAIPSKQAYGTWEFDLYKGADINIIDILLIFSKATIIAGNNGNGYSTGFSISERLFTIQNWTNGSLSQQRYTAADYVKINTWYCIKVTRTLAGVFTLLIKGGAFTPTTGYDGWTLISTTGGLGTNPVTDTTYTTSEYFVIDIDAGDRIANIKLTDGIKQ